MECLYDFIGSWAQAGWLPSIFQHTFMIRGFLAAMLVGPLLGAIGTVVVTKKLAFFTQTIGNAAMSGVAIGLLFGEPVDGTYAGLYGFCLIVALAMTFIKNRSRLSNDTIIGVVLAQVLGLGIVLMILVTSQFNIHQVEAILFGSLITLNDTDILTLMAAVLLAGLVFTLTYNRVMLGSFNRVLSKSRGLNPVLLEYVFVVLMTAVVVASLKLIGALLANFSRYFLSINLATATLELHAVGWVIPGLIAHWFGKQGIFKTLTVLFITAVLVRLIIILIFGGDLLPE